MPFPAMPCQGTTANEKYLDVGYNRTLATYRAAFGEEPKAPQWVPPATDETPLISVVVPATELAALRRDAKKWRDAHPGGDDSEPASDDNEDEEEDEDEDEDEEKPSPALAAALRRPPGYLTDKRRGPVCVGFGCG